MSMDETRELEQAVILAEVDRKIRVPVVEFSTPVSTFCADFYLLSVPAASYRSLCQEYRWQATVKHPSIRYVNGFE